MSDHTIPPEVEGLRTEAAEIVRASMRGVRMTPHVAIRFAMATIGLIDRFTAQSDKIERRDRGTELLWHIIRVANQQIIEARQERDSYKAMAEAYEAEHEAAGPVVESIRPWRNHARVEPRAHKFIEAYDNAERMRQSE